MLAETTKSGGWCVQGVGGNKCRLPYRINEIAYFVILVNVRTVWLRLGFGWSC